MPASAHATHLSNLVICKKQDASIACRAIPFTARRVAAGILFVRNIQYIIYLFNCFLVILGSEQLFTELQCLYACVPIHCNTLRCSQSLAVVIFVNLLVYTGLISIF
jgi:hypothetical protein